MSMQKREEKVTEYYFLYL